MLRMIGHGARCRAVKTASWQRWLMLLGACVSICLVGCGTPVTPTPLPAAVSAAQAEVLHVVAQQSSNGAWSFEVTVQDPDGGPDRYCDGWDVVILAEDGRSEVMVLKASSEDVYTHVLTPPQQGQQTVISSQGGIFVPEGVTRLLLRAHDSVAGWGGQTVAVDLTTSSGTGYEVQPYGGKG